MKTIKAFVVATILSIVLAVSAQVVHPTPVHAQSFAGSCNDMLQMYEDMGLWYYGYAYQIVYIDTIPDGFAGAGTAIYEFILYAVSPGGGIAQEVASETCTI